MVSGGGETIKGTYITIGATLTLLTCLLVMSSGAEATSEEITVSGTVSVAGWNETQIDQLTVAFVSEDHIAIADVDSAGHYSVILKASHAYNVRSFNIKDNLQPISTTSQASSMSWVLYKDIYTPEVDYSLDLVLEKATNYTAPNGARYYLYESGFATLNRLDIKYKDLTEDPQLTVEAGQTFTIPEFIENDGKTYKVTFVGRSPSVTWKDVIWPQSNYMNPACYYGPTSNTLTIHFEGDVILNCQPFTSPFGNTNASTAGSPQYNFDIIFDKDVYVNSYPAIVNDDPRLIASPGSLLGIGDVSIAGIYHGAIQLSEGKISYGAGNNGLANTHFDTITFSHELVASSISDTGSSMLNADVDSLGLIAGTSMTAVLDQDSGKYILKNGDAVVCDSITSVTNKVKFTTVVGDEINTVLLTKGQTKSLDDAVPPEGYRFGGWYLDSKYSAEYDSTVELNDNTTVYAKFISLTCKITITGDGITVKKGDEVIGDGSIIQCGNTLDLIIEERIGYSCLVKVDGVVVSGSTITVPNDDFVVSCEWNETVYSVKCMDGTAVVTVFETCHLGDAITLPVVDKVGFTGWSVGNGMLLGAQYIVNYRDAGENDTITLIASFSDVQDTVWELSVTGADGKAFWTKSNEIGSYGMITVILGEFEKADIPASAEYSVGKISDNTFMIYSVNDADITVAVNITAAAKATAYSVSLTEVAKTQGDDVVPGFKATVTAEDGYIDTAGTFLVRYVYKEKDAETGLWCFTTSGQTAGVNDWEIDISEIGTVGTYSKDMYLEKSGAYLVYGFATYAIESASVTGGVEVFTSPVIMSVSQIQAVIGKP